MIPNEVAAKAVIDDHTSSDDTFGPTVSVETIFSFGSIVVSAASICCIWTSVIWSCPLGADSRIAATC